MTDIKDILKKVKKIEIKTHKLVEGLIAGNYRSVFKGMGMEFSEVREYVPGDDIRAIDWNVTARYNYPFVKEFIEERDLNAYIIFDVSASNNFGNLKSKKQAGFEIAASIMFAALRNNDNIGLCLFTDTVEKFIRPSKGRKHALRLLRELISYEPKSRKTDINQSLAYSGKFIKKRSILFVISDFISGDFEKPLKFLKGRHDVVLLNISDSVEHGIPDIGYVFLEDEETSEQVLVNTSDESFKKAYSSLIKKKISLLSSKMKKLRIDLVHLNTNEPFEIPIRKFFRLREKRMVR